MIDFKINESGELDFNKLNNTIENVTDDELRKQIVFNRIKSVSGDWFNSDLGANLEEFLGQPCKESLSNEVITKIKQEVEKDELCSPGDLFFIPKIEKNSISLLVFIKSYHDKSPNVINVIIDIVNGGKVIYDPYSQ